MRLKIELLGIPQAKQSAKFASIGGKIRSYQPKQVIQKEQSYAWQISQQLPHGFTPTDQPVSVVSMLFVFPPLKSMSKKIIAEINDGIIIPKTTKPDLQDNLCKMVFDAMEGLIYINDSQVWSIRNSSKIYGNIPRIEIILDL